MLFRLVVLSCFDLCRSNSFHVKYSRQILEKYSRKIYSIEAIEGEFYIGGLVLLKFIEPIEYKTTYVELTFTSHNAVGFSSTVEHLLSGHLGTAQCP